MSEKFQAPYVEIGETVHFYHGSSPGTLEVKPCAATVTDVHQGGLCDLAIIEKDNHGFKVPESSVRHKDDPLAKRSLEIDPDTGVWCHRPGHLSAAEVAELRTVLAPKQSVFGASPRPNERVTA